MKHQNRWLALALSCALLAGCGAGKTTGEASASASGSSASASIQEPSGSQSGDSASSGSASGMGNTSETGGGAQKAPDQSQQPEDGSQTAELPQGGDGTDQPYDFTQPVPETPKVDDSYFADAAFVGDSRTDGLLIYGGMKGATNLTSNGLSIFKLEEKKALTIDGKKYTLLEALALHQYGKVYLSLGVNELGYYDDDGFYKAYCKAVDDIRACQPDAVIYIQGLIPLNEKTIKESGGRTYLTNEHLRVYNDLMKQTAQEKQVVYLDLYSAFVDGNGELPAEASKDGVHLRKSYCEQWMDYLRTHTVSYDAYTAGQNKEETA